MTLAETEARQMERSARIDAVLQRIEATSAQTLAFAYYAHKRAGDVEQFLTKVRRRLNPHYDH